MVGVETEPGFKPRPNATVLKLGKLGLTFNLALLTLGKTVVFFLVFPLSAFDK